MKIHFKKLSSWIDIYIYTKWSIKIKACVTPPQWPSFYPSAQWRTCPPVCNPHICSSGPAISIPAALSSSTWAAALLPDPRCNTCKASPALQSGPILQSRTVLAQFSHLPASSRARSPGWELAAPDPVSLTHPQSSGPSPAPHFVSGLLQELVLCAAAWQSHQWLSDYRTTTRGCLVLL